MEVCVTLAAEFPRFPRELRRTFLAGRRDPRCLRRVCIGGVAWNEQDTINLKIGENYHLD